MTKAHLRPCPTCKRHIRVSEDGCPFCAADTSPTFRAQPPPLPPRSRLTRAALFAFGTGAFAGAPGCSSSSAQPDAGPPPLLQDAYGGPALEDAGSDGPALEDAGSDVGQPDAAADAPEPLLDAAYGGPPIDAGHDAETDAPNNVLDAYGGPPLDSGHD